MRLLRSLNMAILLIEFLCREYRREVTADLAEAFEEFARQEHKKLLRNKSKAVFANEK